MNHPSRFCLSLVLAGGMTAVLPAQDTPPAPPALETEEVVERSPSELDDLLGPVALYPDDLIALILPAATFGTDIVLAARYFEEGGDIEKVGEQPWDESVRALAHFPDVIKWMNDNLSWTLDLGDAYALQPAEVMKSVQRLRARAYAAGTLRDTPQQQILADGDVIRIVSAEENVIYVPTYDTEIVYVDRPVYRTEPWITFGIGWHVGSWHRWSCNWYGSSIWVFHDHDHWRQHRWHRHRDHHWRHNAHLHFREHGHAWRHHSHDRDRDRRWHSEHHRHRRDHHVVRPSPYVENHSRNRDLNRRDSDRNRRGDISGDRQRRDRDNNNNNRGSSGPRYDRSRRIPGSANTPVVANPAPTPSTHPAAGTVSGDRRSRARVDAENGNSQRDRRNHSPGSRNNGSNVRVTPVAPVTTPAVTTPTPAPVVNARSGRDNSDRGNSRAAVRDNAGKNRDSGRDYLQRSRNQAPPRDDAPSRQARESAPRVVATPSTASSSRAPAARENRAAVASARSNSGAPKVSNAPTRGNTGGGRQSARSENSGDSGRSRGKSDDADRGSRGSRSDDNGGGGGRGGRGR